MKFVIHSAAWAALCCAALASAAAPAQTRTPAATQSTQAQAQAQPQGQDDSRGVRVGFINLDRVLREAAPARAATARLEQEFSKREKEIDDLSAALKTASDNFERDSDTMSDSQRQQRQRELADMDRDLQRKRSDFQDALNSRKQDELQRVVDRVNQVVGQIAVTGKYDLILQEAAYFNPRVDITDQVIKALNDDASAPAAPAK